VENYPAVKDPAQRPKITDGEFRRENWWIDFMGKMYGVEIGGGSAVASFDQSYIPIFKTGRSFGAKIDIN
jgi:methionine synthase II (cobalamin-independent)